MADEPVPTTAAKVVSPYNAANVLTVLRIVLVPVFVAIVIASGLVGTGARVASCLVFCLASATDFVDGWIARKWSLVTSFGKIADPIADGEVEGRAEHQAPEVDGSTTLVPGDAGADLDKLRPGDLVRARVTATEGVDLIAVPVEMIDAATRDGSAERD